MRPLVSVIVPMYQCEPYLRKCLDSLVNQTLKEIEIICVNDGSPDDSAKIVREYQKSDKRIVLINQKNKGLSEARNAGMRKVHSPYVMFCDSDDFCELNMCEKMYYAMIDNDVDVACSGIKMVYEADGNLKKSDEKYHQIKFLGKQNIQAQHFLRTNVNSVAKIWKMSLIKKYHILFPKGLLYEDACFFFKYFSIAKSAYYLQDALYNYVRRSGSIMNSTFKKAPKAIDHLKIMDDVYAFLKKHSLLKKWQTEFLSLYIIYLEVPFRYLPQDQQYKIWEAAWPIMKKFSDKDIAVLPFWQQERWRQIFRRCYNQRNKRHIFCKKRMDIKNKTESCFQKFYFRCTVSKKDVGLVGLWGNVNYGSVLTNYAAYHFIKDCGRSVLLIERPTNSIEVPYVGDIFHKIPYPNKDIAPQYWNLQAMEELNKAAGTFIVNSDILYSEYSVRVFSQFMLLDYIQNDKKKYAYAASFGFDDFLGDEALRKKIALSLQPFRQFTVREKSGIEVAKKYFNVSAEWVLDPIFLCELRHWKSLAKKGKALLIKGVGCYILDAAEHDGLQIIEDVSRRLNLKNCIINDYQTLENRKKGITVEDWLATYFASDFIITDSFHGTCMAIVLKKPFIVVANVRRGLTRFESILELTGLKDRMVFNLAEYHAKKEFLLNSELDWKMVEQNMKEKLTRSKEILKNMIQ